MIKLSLFSGIGGDDIASEWAGIETICFVENDKYCQRVLKNHWPEIPIIGEVKDVTKERIAEIMADSKCQSGYVREDEELREHRGKCSLVDAYSSSQETRIDIISGGFPCQPHSVAGQRKGSSDERNLWPEFRRVIGEIKPRWVVAENVPGILSSDAGWFFGEILNDLAEMGYATGWATFGAVDVGALHRRNRVFIVGYSQGIRIQRDRTSRKQEPQSYAGQGLSLCSGEDMADTAQPGLERQPRGELQRQGGRFAGGNRREGEDWWAVEPELGRVAHGIPSRVDRLKALGNAVVPQQIYPIYKAIVDIERNK